MVDASAGGKWIRFERHWWLGERGRSNGLFGDLDQVPTWSRETVLLAMRLAADDAIWEGARFPSRRQLATLAGWSEGRIRTLLRHEEWWVDPRYRARWEEVRPAKRAPPTRGAPPPPPKPPAPKPPPKREPPKPGWIGGMTRGRPTLARWTHDELLVVVRRLAAAILQVEPDEVQTRAAAAHLLRLLDLVAGADPGLELEAWALDVELVARAARESRHRLFANDVRRLGWGTDASRDPRTITAADKWTERTKVARSWARLLTRDAAPADDAALDDEAPLDAATVDAWEDVIARLRATTGDWRPRAELAVVQLADSAAEHARRGEALVMALQVHLRDVPGDRTWLVDRDEDALRRLRDHWAIFYEYHGPAPPAD